MTRFTSNICRTHGFTLVEVVVAMSISVVVISLMAMFISAPVDAYQAQSRRAELVDSADSALRFMSRDLRAALPNSLRIRLNGSIVALEILKAEDAARYRSSGAGSLDFSTAGSSFTTVGKFRTSPRTYNNAYLAVYSAGRVPADAYANTVMTSRIGRIDVADNPLNPDEDQLTASGAGTPFRFPYPSPNHRIYIVSAPVTYLCEPATGVLRRYEGYTIAANQASRDTEAELSAAGPTSDSAISTDVSACQFTFAPGTETRTGVVTLSLTLSRANTAAGSESVHLLREVFMENAS